MKRSPFKPRVYLPEKIDLADTLSLDKIYQRLTDDLRRAQSIPALETWLDHYGEVQSALSQAKEERYIACTLHQDDGDRQSDHDYFVDVIEPWWKARDIALERMLAAKPGFARLPDYYEAYRRSVLNDIALYREANAARETEEETLCHDYDALFGGLTALFEGKEQTLPQIETALEDPDRARRETAWKTVAGALLQESEAFETLYERQLAVRQEIAQECGFANYRDYFFRSMERPYSPEDCARLHEAIAAHAVPLARRLHEERRRRLGVEQLRPWDLSVDPLGRPPLRPFRTASELLEKTEAAFAAVSPDLGSLFRKLRDLELIDLEPRPGKTPGGYSTDLAEARLPFTFGNAVGVHYDVVTAQHEAGHAFHTLASRTQRLWAYRASVPMEFCEVASTTLELLGAAQYGQFYPPADARRAERQFWEEIVQSLPAYAWVDAFQHWVYTHPGHTRAERTAAWRELGVRFGTGVDWSGQEEAHDACWHQVCHIYDAPLYYIEYAVGRLGSLQLWSQARKDPETALENYFRALELGGSRPLPDLFATAGLDFDLSARTLAPLLAEVEKQIEGLDAGLPVDRIDLQELPVGGK